MTISPTLGERYPDVSFGTSGVRALVSSLSPEVIAAYVFAFAERMRACGHLVEGAAVVVGTDLRPSSPGIAAVVCGALEALGYRAEFMGPLPTPALALQCLNTDSPGIMVTGSHIPFDRNGIKFYSSVGEILKDDEQAIVAFAIPDGSLEKLTAARQLPDASSVAVEAYVQRYVGRFGSQALGGLRVGLYEHSAVGRDVTKKVLQRLGAVVIPLGRSDEFVPVDTEAVSDADLSQAREWCKDHQLDALVSTDGDGDRPLVFDEEGEFVRGDLLGLMCARELGIQQLAIPVSCNTAIEKFGAFARIVRTRIGSPYVIEGMNELCADETGAVAGFEANGGFLLASSLPHLDALPTRDALLPMLCLLVQSTREKQEISALVAQLPRRCTHSDRIKNVPSVRSREVLMRLENDSEFQKVIAGKETKPIGLDITDGVRLLFQDGDIVHLRASGNAPELRCYAESATYAAAKSLCQGALGRVS
jgi:phosphomannomutase